MKLITKSSVIVLILGLMLGFILGFIAAPMSIFSRGYVFYKLEKPENNVQVSDKDEVKLPPPEFPIQGNVSFDWKVQNMDGTEINLKEELDNQVVFMNFWATWCHFCVMEMPSIEKLYQTYKDRIVFVCISDEDIANIRNFKEKQKYSFPIYRIVGKPPKEFMFRGLPRTLIISRDGNIALKYTGGADWTHETVIKFLDDLLKNES
jgi:thiol-disulfide isomerase/thioredoxin